MPQARKQQSVRRAVAQAANGHCEYCRSPDNCSPASFQVEHIEPLSEGAADAMENLAYSCGGCNGHKAKATHAEDPETGDQTPLFHPRRDSWETHFQWSEDTLTVVGRSAIGRATVARLHLNRPQLTRLRGYLKAAGDHPPK